jgi:hypothetical protein
MNSMSKAKNRLSSNRNALCKSEHMRVPVLDIASGAELSGEKMNFHPHFSFELSQQFDTKPCILTDEADKDGSNNNNIIASIRKRISRSTKKLDSNQGPRTWNESTDSFCFDDSYQQPSFLKVLDE